MGKRKGRAKKNQKKAGLNENAEVVKAPHTFVIFKNRVGKNVRELMQNFRHVMEPYTATDLKIRKGNVIKDYVSVAGMLNVSHLVVFTKSEVGIYMKVIRLPRGPTLTFKIHDYSLTRDVMSSIKRHVNYIQQFEHHPLLVLNNFSGEGMHFKLMSTMFQNMFPSINVNSVKLNKIRRCVLLNYNSEDKRIEFRHYTIKIVPTGVSRSIKKLVQSKVPDLGKYENFDEYIMKSGNLSESEAEPDGPENKVILPQNIGSRGNIASQQSAIRLVELGPRMHLQLIKIEEGVMQGEVMFHEFVQKTEEERQDLKNRLHKKKREKELRKRLQEANKKRKELDKAKQKAKSMKGMKEKKDVENKSDDELCDEDWYKKEVGQEPDKDLFPSKVKRKQNDKSLSSPPWKKLKLSTQDRRKNSEPKKVKNYDNKRMVSSKFKKSVVSSKLKNNRNNRKFVKKRDTSKNKS